MVDLKKMRMISVIWGIVLFVIVVGLTVIGLLYKKQSKEYQVFESEMSQKAMEYMEKKGLDFEEGLKISLQELEEEGLLEIKPIKDNHCEGYVITKSENKREKYIPYLDCGKYKTSGYEKN